MSKSEPLHHIWETVTNAALHHRNASFFLPATIHTEEARSISDVSCKVYVPEVPDGPLRLTFYPTKDQARKLAYLFEFAVSLTLPGENGQPLIEISSDKVYSAGVQFRSGLSWIDEHTLDAEPRNLSIVRYHGNEQSGSVASGEFWITENPLLRPTLAKTNTHAKVPKPRWIDFVIQLAPDKRLRFTRRYLNIDLIDQGDHRQIRIAHLTAQFKKWSGPIESAVTQIDDLLLLASFAAGSWTVCTGWRTYTDKKVVEFYRRSRSIPTDAGPHSHSIVIHRWHAKSFLRKTYRQLQKSTTGDLLRLALAKAVRTKDRSVIDDSFLSHFTALETLILLYKKMRDEQRSIPKEVWSSVSVDLHAGIDTVLRKHQIHRHVRQRVLQRVGLLNNLSFPSAFNECAHFFKVDLSDLWPMNGQKGLGGIRNKLVHGVHFPDDHLKSLMIANLHLQWTVERLLLGVLRWPIDKSTVSPRELNGSYPYHEWQAAQRVLASKRSE